MTVHATLEKATQVIESNTGANLRKALVALSKADSPDFDSIMRLRKRTTTGAYGLAAACLVQWITISEPSFLFWALIATLTVYACTFFEERIWWRTEHERYRLAASNALAASEAVAQSWQEEATAYHDDAQRILRVVRESLGYEIEGIDWK